mmetsp:Transcript_29972/g.72403  ORF Transcript_29972/g.72403 Transcript_29972/m.72403 type:complete len:145 (-) Transcript_29972:16-450(-)
MAELDKAPGKFFRRLDSKTLAEGTALAGEMPDSGDKEASTAESGAMIRASRVAVSTTSSSEIAPNFVARFALTAGANAADWATKLAPKRKANALLRPIILVTEDNRGEDGGFVLGDTIDQLSWSWLVLETLEIRQGWFDKICIV